MNPQIPLSGWSWSPGHTIMTIITISVCVLISLFLGPLGFLLGGALLAVAAGVYCNIWYYIVAGATFVLDATLWYDLGNMPFIAIALIMVVMLGLFLTVRFSNETRLRLKRERAGEHYD